MQDIGQNNPVKRKMEMPLVIFLKKNKTILLVICLFFFVLLTPGFLFRLIIYLFVDAHNGTVADVVWFSYLGLRAVSCAVLIYIIFNSFRRKKTILKLYLIVFFAIEIPFSFLTDSNGMVAYTTINWHCWYWHPVNHLGYRDNEPPPEGSCKHKVLTIGDSYTAGYALTDMKYRFDQLLQRRLKGSGWCMYCGADPGADTKEEFKRLKEYPVIGDYVVLGYYINDMDSVLLNQGMGFPDPPEVTYCLNPLVTGSALFNFIFMKYGYLFHSRPPNYYEFMTRAFKNSKVTDEHYKDLKEVMNYVKQRNAKLIVLVFPELDALEKSKGIYVNQMVAFFSQYCPVVIDIGELVKNIPVQERVASKTDTHPGIKVNQAIADTLYEVLTKQPNLEKQ